MTANAQTPRTISERLLPSVLKGDAETLRLNANCMFLDVAENLEQAASALAAAKAEVNYLKEALEKYGEHDVDCALLGTHEPCSCGLDNILDAITKE